MTRYFYKVFSLKQGEFKILSLSTLFILLLFASYAILRPLRDALGLEGGSEELKWLFLGTFITTLFGSIVAMAVSGMVKRRIYLNVIFIFFALNLVGFYFALHFMSQDSKGFVWLTRIFYIWVSVFNLFIISSAWSLLTDIFNKETSKRLFGIISAGASLGSILGAFGVGTLSSLINTRDFVLISIFLLLLVLGLKSLLLRESCKDLERDEKVKFDERFNKPVGSKNPFIGFRLIITSKYLLAFAGFIFLLTSVSTFLYMEQARIIGELFPKTMQGYKEARAGAFANIDLIVQSLSFFIQIFFTAKIAQYFGVKYLLSILGFIIGIGFIILSFTHPALLPMIIVMSVRRVGEYALIKPGREMLFVPMDSESKYKVKNFFDTIIYRGGDALSAQLEGVLLKFGIGFTLFIGAIISFVWGYLGYYLGKGHAKESE
ncbi:MFS transporter [Helicobacter didelphidarum]|uniref:MFS transporter n=1 Tax=Helicobacter didelphidarum TaxID=2040648 RepID=A0A3D8IMV2_9HELI|nr:MFS transporter [Helicobacter didelphidarum]RDU65964.1 MFS transporter [Helicobacter didelphidarum]